MSPGQPPPQQLLPPPFYPPPGVMTFGNTNYPYPAGATLPPMYPNPQVSLFIKSIIILALNDAFHSLTLVTVCAVNSTSLNNLTVPCALQAQSQVYGGVTYYDTVQQQALPKRSPPRRSSHPVTVRPPPPEVTAKPCKHTS